MLDAGRVGPALKEFPLVAAKLEQVTDDRVDLQREVTRLDVTEKSSFTLMNFCLNAAFQTLAGAT